MIIHLITGLVFATGMGGVFIHLYKKNKKSTINSLYSPGFWVPENEIQYLRYLTRRNNFIEDLSYWRTLRNNPDQFIRHKILLIKRYEIEEILCRNSFRLTRDPAELFEANTLWWMRRLVDNFVNDANSGAGIDTSILPLLEKNTDLVMAQFQK